MKNLFVLESETFWVRKPSFYSNNHSRKVSLYSKHINMGMTYSMSIVKKIKQSKVFRKFRDREILYVPHNWINIQCPLAIEILDNQSCNDDDNRSKSISKDVEVDSSHIHLTTRLWSFRLLGIVLVIVIMTWLTVVNLKLLLFSCLKRISKGWPYSWPYSPKTRIMIDDIDQLLYLIIQILDNIFNIR